MAHLAVLSTPPAVDTVMMPLVDVAATIGKVGAKPSKDALKAATTHAPEETLSSKERDSLLKQLNKTLEAFDTLDRAMRLIPFANGLDSSVQGLFLLCLRIRLARGRTIRIRHPGSRPWLSRR